MLIILIWFIYIYQIHFLKTHNISSIFSYSYQSLSVGSKSNIKSQKKNKFENISDIDRSTATNQEKLGINEKSKEFEASSSSSSGSSVDVISFAVAATLQNSDVTIGANRRKRNYTSNQPSKPMTNKPYIPKPEIPSIIKNKDNDNKNNNNDDDQKINIQKMVEMSDELQIRRPRGRAKIVDENTSITLNVKHNNYNGDNKDNKDNNDENEKYDEQYVDELRFVVNKEFIFINIFIIVIIIEIIINFFNDLYNIYLIGINGFINCLCSWMLFNYNNDLWYDIKQFFQCYCFYDCCWKYFDCFIWDKNKNCYTFCCKFCIKDKDHDSDEDHDDENHNKQQHQNIVDNNNENNNDNESKSIYDRGSLRRLHTKIAPKVNK